MNFYETQKDGYVMHRRYKYDKTTFDSMLVQIEYDLTILVKIGFCIDDEIKLLHIYEKELAELWVRSIR